MNKRVIVIIAVLVLTIAIIAFCTYDKNTVEVNSIVTDKNFEQVSFIEDETEFSDDCIGFLIIEKINLNASIKEGSTSEILKNFIGHIEETALFDGNVGLAAHNRGNEYSYFARLNELEIGDEIFYKTRYFNKKYLVIDKQVILETDWSMLKDTNDNRLTMITCIKNKTNQRLCVQALEEKEKNYE